MSDDTPILSLTGIDKAFGKNHIFEGLALDIRRGEPLTILGSSGCGKRVLLKILIGLQRADAGTVRFDGTDITQFSETELMPIRRRISMLFQGGALFDSLTVGENVAYPLRRQRLPASEIADRVADRLTLVGLPDTARLMPSELSGGMKKRVALARSIAGEPEVVLYDEPTTGLDPINTRRINELIRSIQARLHVTSILVTHDLPSAYMVSDRLAMLSDRKIVAVLPTTEFRASPIPAIRDFVDAMKTTEAA